MGWQLPEGPHQPQSAWSLGPRDYSYSLHVTMSGSTASEDHLLTFDIKGKRSDGYKASDGPPRAEATPRAALHTAARQRGPPLSSKEKTKLTAPEKDHREGRDFTHECLGLGQCGRVRGLQGQPTGRACLPQRGGWNLLTADTASDQMLR